MKLTKDRLKQIIKEELEEIVRVPRDAVTNLTPTKLRGPDPDDNPQDFMQPAKNPTKPKSSIPIADKLFDIGGQLNDQGNKLGPLIMEFGNLVSGFETGRTQLTDHSLSQIKTKVSELLLSDKERKVDEASVSGKKPAKGKKIVGCMSCGGDIQVPESHKGGFSHCEDHEGKFKKVG